MLLAEKLARFHIEHNPMDGEADLQDSINMFTKLLSKGRVLVNLDSFGEIIGYVESWRINYETLGKYLCTQVYPDLETVDITGGNICYLANTAIHPDYRNTEVYQLLKNEFFKQNYMCDFFIGQAYRKRHQPLKIFNRQEFYDKYANVESKEGVVSHG